ncbi:hypothetical protein TNCT_332121 [Trichonephila clavata]|uniref:Uncharacterized protein n=1 Tax=Trichonephila clavata TaxID=2740835 RepID=A0A8X6FQN1_TRICU|nr:hypothetical protein TNCT_332121 [Trichonephila clavata]
MQVHESVKKPSSRGERQLERVEEKRGSSQQDKLNNITHPIRIKKKIKIYKSVTDVLSAGKGDLEGGRKLPFKPFRLIHCKEDQGKGRHYFYLQSNTSGLGDPPLENNSTHFVQELFKLEKRKRAT